MKLISMLLPKDPSLFLKEFFVGAGFNLSFASFLSAIVLVLIVIIISWLVNLIVRFIIHRIVTAAVKKSKSKWDDIFLEQKVFTRMSHLAPALVIWFMGSWALKDYPLWLIAVHKITYIYLIVAGTFVLNSFIESWHQVYLTLPISRHRHIKGYVQLVKIIVILIAVLIIISVVFKKDISSIVTGVGAMAAVLMLVFKDTLLGFVASIQLSSNKMLKEGDWITMPARNADGIVVDVSLNTVKIQNFDKTIVTVPTWALIQESFQNWAGMEEAPGRRIKKTISIDMRSIRIADKSMTDRLSGISILKSFIEEREKDSVVKGKGENDSVLNGDIITNIGLFREYITRYLLNHSKVNVGMPIIVKDLSAAENGLPLEISFFTSLKDGIGYETVQSEIFEVLLAAMNEFDLMAFQNPSGDDIRQLSVTN